MPLADAAELFLRYLGRERNYAANTLAAYRQDLAQFVRYLSPRVADPRVPLGAVHPATVAGFVQTLQARGLTTASIARKLSALRSLFGYLSRCGAAAGNPARAVRLPAPPRPVPLPLPLERIDAALEAADGSGFRGARDRAVIAVFYGGGVQLAELCGLNLSALHLERGTVRVMGRGRRERVVPIGAAAVAQLRTYLQLRAELLVGLDLRRVQAGALFLNCRGRRLARRSVERIVQRCLRAAAVAPPAAAAAERLSPRLLRHTYAAHMTAAGADPGAVRQLLGHAVGVGPADPARPSVEQIRAVYERTHPRSGWAEAAPGCRPDGGAPAGAGG